MEMDTFTFLWYVEITWDYVAQMLPCMALAAAAFFALRPRRKRRLERLEDIGFSSSDFDQLVAQRRLQSASSRRPRRRPRRRRDKKSIFR